MITNDDINKPFDHVIPLYSSIGIGPRVTKAIDKATKDWLDEHPEATTTVEDGSITTEKLRNENVTSAKIANMAITPEKLANLAVTTEKIADDAITEDKLADGSVTSAAIKDGTIVTADLVDGCVTTQKVAHGAITNDKLADDALPLMSADVAGVAKVGSGLAMNGDMLELDGNGDIATAVTDWLDDHPEATTTVLDGSISTIKLADDAVTYDKLADNVENAVIAANYSTELTRNLYHDRPFRKYMNASYVIVDDTYDTHVGMREPIQCKPSMSYWLSYSPDMTGKFYWYFFDEDMTHISHGAHTGYGSCLMTTPATCKYMYLFLYAGGGITLSDSSFICIQEQQLILHPDVKPPWTASDIVARKSVNELDFLLDQFTHETRNMVDVPVGRYQLRADGVLNSSNVANTMFGMGGYISCEPSTEYTATFYGLEVNVDIYLSEYDEDGYFIQRTVIATASNTKTFTTGASTHYIAVGGYKSGGFSIDGAKIQVEKGDTSTPWVPCRSVNDESIGDDGVPAYFEGELATSIASIRENMLGVGRHGDTFLFVTDCHWRNNAKHSPALIKRILDQTNVMMVVNGGDSLQGHLTTKQAAADEILECVNAFTFDKPGLVNLGMFGNHDDNTNNNSAHPEAHLSNDDQFALINQAYGSQGLTYADSGNYYYHDNPSCKVRYLLLDWGANSTAQTAWITSTLSSLPTGWKAVVLIHGIYRTTSGDPDHELIMERQYVLDACEPYKDKILFFMQGHTHWDNIVNAYPNDTTPIIITSCDTLSADAGAVAGTVTEQCFDVVTFDYTAGNVKCVRVGRGSDRQVNM